MAGEEEVWGVGGALEGQGLEKFPLFTPHPPITDAEPSAMFAGLPAPVLGAWSSQRRG